MIRFDCLGGHIFCWKVPFVSSFDEVQTELCFLRWFKPMTGMFDGLLVVGRL